MGLRFMTMWMRVYVIPVAMRVRVNQLRVSRCAPEKAEYVRNTEPNQHQPDGKLHRQTDSGRNRQVEKDDCRSDHENCERMSQAPKNANPGRFCDLSFAADNRSHGDHMVGIGRVANS